MAIFAAENPLGIKRRELFSGLSLTFDLSEGRGPGHALRVALICERMALTLRLRAPERLMLFYSALLHDSGIPFISPALCRALGPWARMENELLHKHPASAWGGMRHWELLDAGGGAAHRALTSHTLKGGELARRLGFPSAVARTIACHHELPGGTGYPRGLTRRRIPRLARIISLADKLDYILSLEASGDVPSALELVEERRELFDPEVLSAFRKGLSGDGALLDGLLSPTLREELLKGLPEEWEVLSQRELMETAAWLGGASDIKSGYRAPHSLKVGALVEAMGRVLGVRGRRLLALRLSGLLHDIGVLSIESRIPEKRNSLEAAERRALRAHSLFSEKALSAAGFPPSLAFWAASHHERPDGRGYPRGLKGGEIPLEGRLLALADAYSALTSPRPFRPALSRKASLSLIMEEEVGKFDEALFAPLISLTRGHPKPSGRPFPSR